MKPTPQAIRAAEALQKDGYLKKFPPCGTLRAAEIIDREMGELIEELPAKLASALWNCSTLRHGMFTPPDFPRICEQVIREALNLKPYEKQ